MDTVELKIAIIASLDNAEALERVATEGPWEVHEKDGTDGWSGLYLHTVDKANDIEGWELIVDASTVADAHAAAFARNTFAYHLAQDRKLVHATCERCGDTGTGKYILPGYHDESRGYVDASTYEKPCECTRPAELQKLARALGVEG